MILNGLLEAETIKDNLTQIIKNLNYRLKLVVIIVGNNPASKIYVQNKKKSAEKIGMLSQDITLDENTSQKELLAVIDQLNNDDSVDGILVQLPLPQHLDAFEIICRVSPMKDVDCFHPKNVGLLSYGQNLIAPCTPSGIMHLIKVSGAKLQGAHAVVLGRSNIVGRPVAQLLLNADCSVTLVHSKTKNLSYQCSQADILIVAAGSPGLVRENFVKKGAIVIDVGINRTAEGKIMGDVAFEEVVDIASAISPVPGGVGPMTIAYLLHNTMVLGHKRRVE